MTQKIINIGTSPNDGNGDPLRTAMEKINQNFSDLYLQVSGGGGGVTPVDGNITLTPGSAGSVIVNANTSEAAMRVTQIGTGPAFIVEDSSYPDNTPFIITSSGNVGIGLTPAEKLHVSGGIVAVGDISCSTFTSITGEGAPPLRVASTTQVDNLTAQYATTLVNGTSNVRLISSTVAMSVNGTTNVLVISSTSANVTGNANVSGTLTSGNLSVAGTISTAGISNGTSNIRLNSSGNVAISVSGNGNVLTTTGTGIDVIGYITATGNVNVANIGISGTIVANTISSGNSNIRLLANDNITISATGAPNVFTVTATGANVTGTANVTGNVNVGNLGTSGTITTGTIENGTSNVRIASGANVTVSAAGNANVLTVTATGANVTGTANITGNVNVGNLGTDGQIISTLAAGTAPFVVTSTTQVANLNVAVSGSVVNGNSNVRVAANANVTVSSTGNADVLTVTGTGIIVSGYIGRGTPVTKTADFTVGDTENWIIINGTGNIIVTMPAASAFPGREITFKTVAAYHLNSATSNIVPIDNVSAGIAILTNTAGKWATVVSNGTNWVIMAQG